VAVCGIGNVALDCARVLLRPPQELVPTDLATHALRQLQGGSRVREVHLVARRGPVQVSGRPRRGFPLPPPPPQTHTSHLTPAAAGG
jgi:adrenodoxin-NADP+ reductase